MKGFDGILDKIQNVGPNNRVTEGMREEHGKETSDEAIFKKVFGKDLRSEEIKKRKKKAVV